MGGGSCGKLRVDQGALRGLPDGAVLLPVPHVLRGRLAVPYSRRRARYAAGRGAWGRREKQKRGEAGAVGCACCHNIMWDRAPKPFVLFCLMLVAVGASRCRHFLDSFPGEVEMLVR